MATIMVPSAFSLPMERSIARRFYKLRVSDSPVTAEAAGSSPVVPPSFGDQKLDHVTGTVPELNFFP